MKILHNIGDTVIVYDSHGYKQCQGDVVGRGLSDNPNYDVQPSGTKELHERIINIPSGRIRVPPIQYCSSGNGFATPME